MHVGYFLNIRKTVNTERFVFALDAMEIVFVFLTLHILIRKQTINFYKCSQPSKKMDIILEDGDLEPKNGCNDVK